MQKASFAKKNALQRRTFFLRTAEDAVALYLASTEPAVVFTLQVKRTQLYLTTLQMQICIYKGDLAGAQHQLDTCIGLTHTGAEYRPGFIR